MSSVPSDASVYVDPSDNTTGSSLAMLYYCLEIAAIIFIGLGILPALLIGRVSRTVTWYMFMLSWMWFAITNTFLAGRHSSTEPPFPLCLFQAALIYASPVFTSATGLAFIIELYLRLGSMTPGLPISKSRLLPLVALPLLLNLTVFLEVITYGLHNRSAVLLNPSGLYCHITTDVQANFAALLIILLVVPAILIEALTAISFYYNYKHVYNNLGATAESSPSPFSPTLFIRTVFFTFVATIALAISAVSLEYPSSILKTGQTVAQASLPLACALVFLTQMDIVQSWSLPRRSSHKLVCTNSSAGTV
ncbi:hypothetical protein MSAN_00685600 [Mycena sanguinolenta]|uniref:Uncharacterized protein n=1 Tax=Mycena sanguinolenta TaxID=230812 RepID=A0A8H6Z796_9AGAR|nr:hypothetical protein MSAN_00685600 [Mycena sanguinolenta]